MSTSERASFGTRLGASMIDFLVTCMIQGVLFIPFILIPLIQKKISGQEVTSRTLWVTMISFTYLILRDLPHGRSLGKKALRLQVRGEDAERVSADRLLLRNIFVIVYPIEAIWLLVTSGQKRLGDLVARTGVYKDQKDGAA